MPYTVPKNRITFDFPKPYAHWIKLNELEEFIKQSIEKGADHVVVEKRDEAVIFHSFYYNRGITDDLGRDKR